MLLSCASGSMSHTLSSLYAKMQVLELQHTDRVRLKVHRPLWTLHACHGAVRIHSRPKSSYCCQLTSTLRLIINSLCHAAPNTWIWHILMLLYWRLFANASEVNHSPTRFKSDQILWLYIYFPSFLLRMVLAEMLSIANRPLCLATGHAVAWSHSRYWQCNNGSVTAEQFVKLNPRPRLHAKVLLQACEP